MPLSLRPLQEFLVAVVLLLLAGAGAGTQSNDADTTSLKSVVAGFAGRDIAPELRHVEQWWPTPLECREVFELPPTGERFEVRVRDRLVTRWELDAYRPALDVRSHPKEEFERAFLARYYTRVPSAELIRVTQPDRAGGYEQRFSGRARGGNGCWVVWDEARDHVRKFTCWYSSLRITPVPNLDFEEAVRRAIALAEGWTSVARATFERSSAVKVIEAVRNLPNVTEDAAGVQRLVYGLELRLSWDQADTASSRRPSSTVVLVDAHTGVCFETGGLWPPGCAPDCLSTVVRVNGRTGSLDLFYRARLRDGVVFICAEYLDSLIWAGRYQRSPGSDEFTVTYEGKEWRGALGGRTLTGPATRLDASAPPWLVEEKLYLPQDMVTRITGWDVRLGSNIIGEPAVVLTAPNELPATLRTPTGGG